MGKLQEFLIQKAGDKAEAVEVCIETIPHPFLVREITEAENEAIREGCMKQHFDKRTRRKQKELDARLYNARLIVECCVEPNFKDAELQRAYGVMGAEALVKAVFNPGQYSDLLSAVTDINGFADDVNDLVDDAKNSLPVETEKSPTGKVTTPTTPSTG